MPSSSLASLVPPVEFVLFGLTLAAVAVFHRHTFWIGLAGVLSVVLYKTTFTGFKTGIGLVGLATHLGHEWVTLANLFCLLMGFVILARHFEKSQVPVILPKYLPDDWKGGFALLAMIWLISSFIDNIAAALIGGAMAHQLFRSRVHLGFVAGIVAASNAGGAFSVVGDTTTSMMWISGVRPGQVFEASLASAAALAVFGTIAAKQQHRYSPILSHRHPTARVDWARIFIVGLILVSAVTTNVVVHRAYPELTGRFPFLGVAVWAAIAFTIPVRRHDWEALGPALKSTCFLLFLVTSASMMPVESLPGASWETALGLGFLSAVFDNIPLTALAIQQNGYDWGYLAFSVGFGGSMLWFGSSAGVGLSSLFPETRSIARWVRHAWHVPVAYVVGFITLLALMGWHPQIIAPH